MIPLAIAAIFGATASFANTWDAAADFSANSNPNGSWTYGYYLLYGAPGLDLPPEPATFIKLTSSNVGANYSSWFTPSEISVLNITGFSNQTYLTLAAGLAPLTAFYAPVVRWTASSSGQYSIIADFEYFGLGAAKTPTSQVGLRVDDLTLAYAYIGGPGSSLRITRDLYLTVGESLDFFVARDQHAITFSSSISAVPEPTSSLLLLFGIGALGMRLLTHRATGHFAAVQVWALKS
jgi:hypothetical protein